MDRYLTEAEAREWWERKTRSVRATIEAIPAKAAARAPAELRTIVEEAARAECAGLLTDLEFPGMDALGRGRPDA